MMWTESEAIAYYKFLRGVRKSYTKKWTGRHRQDPYKFGFQYAGMTPIESNLWHMIRMFGLEMYPQFPVGKYYLDFANPFYKIALEADGKVHNLEEVRERDMRRTMELGEAGWKIYRITGRELNQPFFIQNEDGEDVPSELSEFIMSLARNTTYVTGESRLVTSDEIAEKLKKEEKYKPKILAQNRKMFDHQMPHKDDAYMYKYGERL